MLNKHLIPNQSITKKLFRNLKDQLRELEKDSFVQYLNDVGKNGRTTPTDQSTLF